MIIFLKVSNFGCVKQQFELHSVLFWYVFCYRQKTTLCIFYPKIIFKLLTSIWLYLPSFISFSARWNSHVAYNFHRFVVFTASTCSFQQRLQVYNIDVFRFLTFLSAWTAWTCILGRFTPKQRKALNFNSPHIAGCVLFFPLFL